MLWSLIRTVAKAAATMLVLPYLVSRIRTQRDRDRAEVIEIVARAVATEVLLAYPNADWAALVDQVVRLLGDQLPPGVRTANEDVLRRAAAVALSEVKKVVQ